MQDLLSKYPAPWRVEVTLTRRRSDIVAANGQRVMALDGDRRDLLEQICQWRNAEAIQQQTGWRAEKRHDGWRLSLESCMRSPGGADWELHEWVDANIKQSPSEAILAAGAWLKEREAAQQKEKPHA